MAGRIAGGRTPRQNRRFFTAAGMCSIVIVAVAIAGCGSASSTHSGARPSTPAKARPAAPSSPAAIAASALPAGQQGSQQEVPWAQVGPGWILAEWSPAWNGSGATSLFLVDPAGGRYLIDTFPASSSPSTPTSLMAWSGDGQRALLTSVYYTPSGASQAFALLNLRTLASTPVQLANGSPIGFTRPDGLALLASVQVNARQAKLERVSLTGQLELSYPTSLAQGNEINGSVLYSPDGTELAVGTCHVVIASASCASSLSGIELITNAGQALRYLPVSPASEGCMPLRWWTAEELLASCYGPGPNSSQLWIVPTSGSTPTALTASPPVQGDLGDSDAWQLPSGTYLEEAGACSFVHMAKLQPNGLTAPVVVPGVPSGESIVILGALGDRLAVRNVPGSPETCAHGPSLMWYSPATNSVTPLLGGSVNGGYVQAALLFGQP